MRRKRAAAAAAAAPLHEGVYMCVDSSARTEGNKEEEEDYFSRGG